MSYAWGTPQQGTPATKVSNSVASILEMFRRRKQTPPGPIDPNELRKRTLPWMQSGGAQQPPITLDPRETYRPPTQQQPAPQGLAAWLKRPR